MVTTSISVTVENPAGAGRSDAVGRYGCARWCGTGREVDFAAGGGTGTEGTPGATGDGTCPGGRGRGRDVGTPRRAGGEGGPGLWGRAPGRTAWGGAAGAGATALGGTGPTGHCSMPAYSCAVSGFSATVAPRQRSS